ncbi:outer membrane receptor protein involved in Fe transport [Sphingobacterium paludis]|uniref:Outer membrane receptor protein involved in Fe transport n=2 Tax=Sphingobacterium paludis TaxID=1476465 RepID=A0A4R7CTA1_9SPHI|nr:outer membrane receptor protein involved in Fe transport [Sphingobacterium paludis]
MRNMKQIFTLVYGLILSFAAHHAFAQSAKTVQGMLRDTESRVVAGASVQLITANDTLGTSSSQAGIFTFANVKAQTFTIKVSSLGFEPFEKQFTLSTEGDKMVIPSFELKGIENMLEEVVVDGVLTVQVKGDTLEYTTKDLKLRDNALVEDALKRLQGVEVDKDGAVTAQGEQVVRVRINGKDFFGGDVKTATQNLPADIINKIQVIDDYGDMANLTGNKTGDAQKILNIEIDPEKNRGFTTTLRAGYGTDDRYQATGSAIIMRDKMQFSVLGNLNNINAPLFDFNTQGGGARRRMGGGGGPGGGGMFGGSNGITNTGSLGLNYRQDFSDKVTVYGSYSFGHDDNIALASSLNRFIYPDSTLDRNTESNTNTIGNSHRFEANLEWKPSEKDFIKITPQLSYRSTKTNSFSFSENLLNEALYNTENNSLNGIAKAPNVGVSALYNRRLNDKGRNLFINMNISSSGTRDDQDRIIETLVRDPNNADMSMDSLYRRTLAELDNTSWNGGATVSYLEPVSKYGKIELAYDYNVNSYDNSRQQDAFQADGSGLNDPRYVFNRMYDYSFSTHQFGANYNFNNDKIKYSVGVAVQPTLLDGDASIDGEEIHINRSGFNVVPIARFEYKFDRQKNLQLNYSGRANEPSITQIQPFTDNSNPTNIITGNPNLDAEFQHNVRLRFNSGDFQKGKTFFMILNGTLTSNKIVSNNLRQTDPALGIIQETSYLNEDGAYSMRGFYHYGRSFKNKVYSLNFMGSVNFNNNPSYTEGNLNKAQNWVLMQGMMFRYLPSENLEINPGVRYTWDHTYNTLNDRSISMQSWAPTLIGSVNITPTLVFGADLSKTFFQGNAYNDNPFIVNTYIEKRMLKGNRGALRLQAFDLLNEQTNISRTVTDIQISDSRVNRLGRYFMLQFTFKLQKFASGLNPFQEDRGPGGMRRPRM